MKTDTKRLVVVAALIVLTIWPLVHIYGVFRYDINPWKFCGWGMYSAPQLLPYVRWYAPVSNDYVKQGIFPTEVVPHVAHFLNLRRGLRKLVKPDKIAKSIFETHPHLDEIVIRVFQRYLSRDNGMIEQDFVEYRYEK